MKVRELMKALLRHFAAIAVSMVLASSASALTVTEWNFNANPGPAEASTGTGTVTGAFFPISGGFGPPVGVDVGSPGDTNPVLVGGVPNNSVAGRSGPNPGEADGPTGIRNQTWTTSTANKFGDLTVSWHMLIGYRASRFYQLFATTDGTNFSVVPTGTGSSASILGTGALAPNGVAQTVASATVSADGLVDVRTIDNMIPDPDTGDAFVYELSYTFPNGSGHEDNPNFAVKIGAVQDPAAGDYVSSFAGTTNAADPMKGYIRDTALGGNIALFDLVRVSANVPEPTSFALAFCCGLALAGVRRRKS